MNDNNDNIDIDLYIKNINKELKNISLDSCFEFESMKNDFLTFYIKNIDFKLANNLRRIMFKDIDTMAIEHIFIQKNTSVMSDEILSQRLSLIPILADPDDFSEEDTINFKLEVKNISKENDENYKNYENNKINLNVHSNQLIYNGNPIKSKIQLNEEYYPKSKYEDILILKLKSNQEIKVDMYCIKGNGRKHSKFCPVSIVQLQKVNTSDAKFVIETIGVLHPLNIILKALQILKNY